MRLARLVALDLPIDVDGAPKADGAHGGSFFVVVRDRRCQKALLHLLKPEADGGHGYARHASLRHHADRARSSQKAASGVSAVTLSRCPLTPG